MRVTILCHYAAVAVNQQQFVALSNLPDMDIELLTPARWRTEINGQMIQTEILPSVKFPLHRLPVFVPGHVWLHFYPSLRPADREKFKPDVVLSIQEPWSLCGQQAITLAKRLRVPFVFETHQNLVKNYPPPFRQFEQRTFRVADAAFASSEQSRRVMLERGVIAPTSVVPYGIDVSLFYPGVSPRRAELGFAPTDIVIGYLGRLVPEKGLFSLVEAAKILTERYKGQNITLKYLMVGDGEERAALEQRIREQGMSGNWVFSGAVPHKEAAEYVRCMNLFVLPSLTTPKWAEQFGRVIIEALAARVPVVGSDSGEIPNLIRATGGGLVFKENNALDLADKIATLVDNPAEFERLGQIGQAAVRSRYTMEAVALGFRDILEKGIEYHRQRKQ